MSNNSTQNQEETPANGETEFVAATEESPVTPDADGALDEASVEAGDASSEKQEGYISPMEMLIQAQAKAEEYRNDYLRALADMKNLRQRTEREMQQARQFAIESFAKDLLQVADNLERALGAIPASDDPVAVALTDGVRMVATGLESTLKKHGVTRIQALNTPFDPNLHQAVMQIEDPEVPPDQVVRELQTGYLLNQRLLRPSMVGISRN
ncbi:Protein GrpE [Candidatus Magnetaquicoccaceae bacterium FCR-1]|uniref:Protein GrpE n=1 Tax=Candidatus Magnetaquiglobus chichijimensis TaxID=3141448 RepID=A0ABQ0C7C1_9PROT